MGSALAGIGAILYCCKYPQVKPTMGSLLGLKAFVAAVLGASVHPRRHAGGLAIALRRSSSTPWVFHLRRRRGFVILILVLLVKPTASWREHERKSVGGGKDESK